MYEGIIEPGYEMWALKLHERKKMEAVEMNCLRNICSFRRIDRVSNVEIRSCGKNVSVSQRIDQGVCKDVKEILKIQIGYQEMRILKTK